MFSRIPPSVWSLLRLLAVLALTGRAGAFTYVTFEYAGGDANIFAAGLESTAATGGGALPTQIHIPSGSSRSLMVGDVFGATHNAGSNPSWGPDGFSFNVNINPVEGISGLYAGRAMALLGVFLGDAAPSGEAPETIDFTSGTGIGRNFYTLAPVAGQVFLIGDGWASVSDQQVFYIPDDATRLFIGFADAGGFQGNPSNFSDNNGGLNGSFLFDIPDPVPEPSGPALAVGAPLALAARRRRGPGRFL